MPRQITKGPQPARGVAGVLLSSGLLAACAAGAAAGPVPDAAARAQAGGQVYVTNQLDDTLSVINARTNRVTATVPAGTAPESVAGTPGHRPVYLADSGAGRGSVLPARTGKSVATLHAFTG